MPKVIQVENLSKAYQLGTFGTGTISHDLERYWARLRGKEDPFLKVGEVNDRTQKGTSNIVWSLKDINFEIEQGDAVGIIGRNGAGKSTLLKILSRTTSPTTGKIKMKGRVASLLEVGTGFHPELSGRENIFLNGAILGMRKAEIKRKFDEIVDFSGVERYIDTPVKRYSSGMYVRLAFGVAAYLESEILIVDEVLAVGDAEFQKKCLGKMNEVSKGQGKTVLFVSHNMGAVQKLCKTGIYLDQGVISSVGATQYIISKYLQNSNSKQAVFNLDAPHNADSIDAYATKIRIEDIGGNLTHEMPVGTPWNIRVSFKLNKPVKRFIIGMGMTSSTETPIRTTWSNETDLNAGYYEAVFQESTLIFSPGSYNVIIGLSSYDRSIQYIDNAACFNISEITAPTLDKSILVINNVGLLLNPMPVKIKSI